MNSPDFSKMSKQDLKGYILAHRQDEKAWTELVSRRNKSAKRYPPPLDEEGKRIAEQIFREKFGMLSSETE